MGGFDLGSEYNKVDRPVDPRGGSTSSPELICRRQTKERAEGEEVGSTAETKRGRGILRVAQPPNH